MSVGSALHSLPKPSNNGDDGWTDNSMAELEKELGLALEEQVKSSSASAPTSPSPRSVEAPQDEIQSRERSEATGSRPEELQEVCRHGTAQQAKHSVRSFSDIQQLRSVTSTVMHHEPLETPPPQLIWHWGASLRRRSEVTKTCIQRSVAKPTIP